MNQGHLDAIVLRIRCLLVVTTAGFGQESIKVAVLKQPPPESIAAPKFATSLNRQGYRIQDDQGRTLADIWLRKAIPGLRETGGAQRSDPLSVPGRWRVGRSFAIRDRGPRLSRSAHRQGRLHDAVRLAAGQRRSSGREHVSRLFACFARGERSILALPARKQLEETSAESAGTSHPAVFLLLAAPPDASKSDPAVIRDAEKNTWSVVVPLFSAGQGTERGRRYPVRLVVVGAAAA